MRAQRPQTCTEHMKTQTTENTNPVFAFHVGALCHQRNNIARTALPRGFPQLVALSQCKINVSQWKHDKIQAQFKKENHQQQMYRIFPILSTGRGIWEVEKWGGKLHFGRWTRQEGTDFGKSAWRGGRISGNRRKNAIFSQKISAAFGGQKGAFLGPTFGLTENPRKTYWKSRKIWKIASKNPNKVHFRSYFRLLSWKIQETGFVD